MRPTLYSVPIPFHQTLSILPRPRGGEWLSDEIAGLHAAGVRVLVSLLMPSEAWELELSAEADLCEQAGIILRAFPIIDRNVPSFGPPTFAFIDQLAADLRQSLHVAVHCRLGIGRSALIAASVMVRLGTSPERAFAALSLARDLTVPDTPEQSAWVTAYAQWLTGKR